MSFPYILPLSLLLLIVILLNSISYLTIRLIASDDDILVKSNTTLRQFLSHPDGFHLGMAPSFFGFYGYFGALIALEDEIGILPIHTNTSTCDTTIGNNTTTATCSEKQRTNKLTSVAGASAGAMAAVLLSAGIHPRIAADFTTKFDFSSFADPPGFFALLKGGKFESTMKEFLLRNHAALSPDSKIPLLEESIIPVAVSSFDIRTIKGKILTHGCMAKAARASATFPFLFQPTEWRSPSYSKEDDHTAYLIDGGLVDPHGLLGLTTTIANNKKSKARIVHLSIGDIYKSLPSPLDPQDIDAIASISIVNTPTCGPWAMENGKKAVESARIALLNALDLPMYYDRNKDGHFEIRIDASLYS